jgi:WD40 repeat protein
VAPAAQSVEPRGPDTRRAAARISGGFALAALAAAQFIDADGAPAPDLLITGLGLLALPVGLLLAGAGGRRARWVLLPLAVLLALRPFVVDAGDQSNPFSHPGDLFGDRRLHLVISPVFDLVVAGLGIAAGILCARRQGLPGWRRHLPWLLAAAATAGAPAQVLERGQPLTNWPALLPPLTGWPALLPALTGWLATALAFGLSAALLTVPARAVARKPSALRALVAAGVAAAVTATAVLVAARTTPTYSSRAIATNMLVWDIAFSPDGTKIATSGRERSDTIYLVRLWDVRTGRNTVTFNDGERYNEVDFAFDPTRSMVVTGSHNGGVRLWDADTGYESDNLRPGGGDNVAFSADGKRLAMANTRGDDELFVLDLGSNQETKVLDGRSFSSYHVAFHPKSDILAAANSKELKLVDLDKENKQEVLSMHSGDIWDIAFSADGSRLATAGSDDFVYIWDWNRRSDPIATLTNGVDGANDVALSPDGKTLALASDGRVQLWSIDDNRITVLPGHPDDTTGVAFAPDGRTLASSSRDGTIRLWPLPRPN